MKNLCVRDSFVLMKMKWNTRINRKENVKNNWIFYIILLVEYNKKLSKVVLNWPIYLCKSSHISFKAESDEQILFNSAWKLHSILAFFVFVQLLVCESWQADEKI